MHFPVAFYTVKTGWILNKFLFIKSSRNHWMACVFIILKQYLRDINFS